MASTSGDAGPAEPDSHEPPAADRPDLGGTVPSTELTVLYDEGCAVCVRARDWLLTQPCLVRLELVGAGSVEARRRFGSVPWLGTELVVVDEVGRVWAGPAAFLVCLWATVRYRPWAYRLSRPSLAPLAARFFRFGSKRRDRWSAFLAPQEHECSWCAADT